MTAFATEDSSSGGTLKRDPGVAKAPLRIADPDAETNTMLVTEPGRGDQKLGDSNSEHSSCEGRDWVSPPDLEGVLLAAAATLLGVAILNLNLKV